MTQRFNGGYIPRNPERNTMQMSQEEQQVREIFGPGSNSLKAAQMAKHQPALYASLKQRACYEFGLIPEAMLPRASQLTREQREAKTRADLAAQKDELIEVGPVLAARLGVSENSKVTWENFQRLMGRKTD